MQEQIKKPSEIFEGENSSLRKTYEEATNNMNYIDKKQQEFKQEFGIHFSASELQFALEFLKEIFSELTEKIEKEKKEIGYGGKDEPTTEDEFLAEAFDSKAEAFFAGFDNAIDKILQIINEKMK